MRTEVSVPTVAVPRWWSESTTSITMILRMDESASSGRGRFVIGVSEEAEEGGDDARGNRGTEDEDEDDEGSGDDADASVVLTM